MSFNEQIVQAVWQKGTIVSGNDPNIWRKDQCRAWMGRELHGDRQSQYGWEVDHINPSGGDNLTNLRPLQWVTNAEKSEGRLTCPVTSQGVSNTRR